MCSGSWLLAVVEAEVVPAILAKTVLTPNTRLHFVGIATVCVVMRLSDFVHGLLLIKEARLVPVGLPVKPLLLNCG